MLSPISVGTIDSLETLTKLVELIGQQKDFAVRLKELVTLTSEAKKQMSLAKEATDKLTVEQARTLDLIGASDALIAKAAKLGEVAAYEQAKGAEILKQSQAHKNDILAKVTDHQHRMQVVESSLQQKENDLLARQSAIEKQEAVIKKTLQEVENLKAAYEAKLAQFRNIANQ